MRITQVISDSNIGGAGILLSSVVNGLKGDFDFEVILPRGSLLSDRLPRDGVKITELDIKSDASLYAPDVITFYKYFCKTKPDLVHTHASLSARLGAKLAGVAPRISTRHCSKPEPLVKRRGALLRLLYDISCDLTLSTADFATKNLIAEGVRPDRILTIKNGSAKRPLPTEERKAEIRRSLGIPVGARIIGSVARLESVKGQDLLIRAAAEAVRLFPDVYFVLVGTGSEEENYKKLTARLGLERRVIFAGYTPRPWEYEGMFYVNVNSSRATETSCLVTSECMAMGIPTVGSDFGGNKEMIFHLKNGLLFESDNKNSLVSALALILSDRALRDKLCKGCAKVYGELFSLDRMLKEYKALYDRLLGRAHNY